MSGVSPSSLSLTWPLRIGSPLATRNPNGLTARPWAAFLVQRVSAQLRDSQRAAGAESQVASRTGRATQRCPQGRDQARIVADDCADIRADVILNCSRPSFFIAANATEFHACDPSAKLFDAPWVVQDASKSFGRRSAGVVAKHDGTDLLLGISCGRLTVARQPPPRC